MFRKILDRVGFEHQVGTYPYENDPSTPPPPGSSVQRRPLLLERNEDLISTGK